MSDDEFDRWSSSDRPLTPSEKDFTYGTTFQNNDEENLQNNFNNTESDFIDTKKKKKIYYERFEKTDPWATLTLPKLSSSTHLHKLNMTKVNKTTTKKMKKKSNLNTSGKFEHRSQRKAQTQRLYRNPDYFNDIPVNSSPRYLTKQSTPFGFEDSGHLDIPKPLNFDKMNSTNAVDMTDPIAKFSRPTVRSARLTREKNTNKRQEFTRPKTAGIPLATFSSRFDAFPKRRNEWKTDYSFLPN
eukprot:TRINITY_DN1034_c0_g1_i1.p1 TRINITY_DN1034_c0_g1~~TRINITY_DN1034_c0_g1_i1.p1  ORF type:complete len:242 (-),score=64.46 TRINITY_DN1034_c0_g1_i1:11-736(-)